ncbi:MAG: hypothetical protein ACTSX7_10765 [Alphaproteobacteria bacterium]
MAQLKLAMSAAVFLAAVIGAPASSIAASIPTTINLGDDGHKVTVLQVQQQLRASGFTNLGTIVRDGRIFELAAVWEGEPVNLKVNARTRTIRQIVAAADTDSTVMPTRLSLVGDAHEVTIPKVVTGLRGLGFTAVSNVQQSGRIFLASADWRGESTDLRYDASSGEISDRSVIETRPAEAFPSSILTAQDPHQTSVQDMRRSLAALGFTQIDNMQKDGRIFTMTANWQGEALDLRVNTASRRIVRQ